MVTVNGRLFKALDDSGFRKIFDPILAAINKSAEYIPKTIQEYATNLRLKIIQELKERMISLKLDAVTRLERGILGINIQFVSEGSIE